MERERLGIPPHHVALDPSEHMVSTAKPLEAHPPRYTHTYFQSFVLF